MLHNKFWVLVFCIGLCSGAGAQQLMYYVNNEDGYALQIPEDWIRSENRSERLSLLLLAPEASSKLDEFREYFTVTIFENKYRDPDQFVGYYSEMMSENVNDYVIVEDGILGEQEVEQATYLCEYVKSGSAHQELTWFVFANKKVLVLSGVSTPADMTTYRPLFEEMAESFSMETNQDAVEGKN